MPPTPPVLYHASPDRAITEFTPRQESMRDPLEGPQVFATPSKEFASIFIVKTDDSWANSGTISDIPYMIISDRARFESLDTGGCIYHLPTETFTTNPEKGLGTLEWTSSVAVTPTSKECYESGLEAMLDAGVQVYFLTADEYARFKVDPDHMAEKLNQLQSENQKLGRNVRHPFIP